jgi:hypothetical protein
MDSPVRASSLTYPQGFLDFLTASAGAGQRVGGYQLQHAGLQRFNRALHAISPQSPALTLEQMASAAQRALDRYPDGGTPAFVTSRLDSLVRLESMVADPDWLAGRELHDGLDVLRRYLADEGDLIPDRLPVIGRLDDAVLVDVALQYLGGELADYEDVCRFRRSAADCAGMAVADTGLGRQPWLEALQQAQRGRGHGYDQPRRRYIPDPRASLFHVT